MEFLTFTYRVPGEPSKNRVYIWRSIKELGAVYLQQGVALLPCDEDLCTTLLNLREQVHGFGGKSTIGKLSFLLEEDEKDIIDQFNRQVDEECGEFIRNCQSLVDEIDQERTRDDFNFSDIIENEEEFKKFQRWYEKIKKRNYFKSEQQVCAMKVLREAKKKLQEYSDEVYRRDEHIL